MILVPNRRQLLSGNKYIFLFLITFLLACSKKTAPVISKVPSKAEPVKEKVEKAEPEKKEVILPHSIALLLPFYLNTINPETADQQQINRAALALDYYQGFKLALDSLAKSGTDFKLNVYDSREQEIMLVNLARSKSVQENDLIVGPVFPSSIKIFNDFYKPEDKLQISPLAASTPDNYTNANLVTINNTVDQHGWKIADFINTNYTPSQVNLVIINTQKSDDEKFAAPIRKYIRSLSNRGFLIHERPNSIGLETFLNSALTNIIILTSDEKSFVLPTIDRLYKLSQSGFRIDLFGHPNWIRAQFLNVEKMQALNAKITASYFIDYKSPAVKKFTAVYRQQYGLAPSEFSFKGFDTGFYFGKLLGQYGKDYPKHLTDLAYEGLHNRFHFQKDQQTGFSNAEVMMLKYSGFELQEIR
ncbi:MAG: amino acid ABC transporter substrate-binding protein [Daejeonella sp.]